MGPCTVPPETASLDNKDNLSYGDEDDCKDNINSPKLDNRTTKCGYNGKGLCNGDAKLLCSLCPGFYICSFCHIRNTHKDHERF